jgi:hypothetical protein
LGKQKVGFSRVGHARLLKTKERALRLAVKEGGRWGVLLQAACLTDPLREE